MKKKLFAFCLFVLSSSFNFAQWFWQNPSISGNDLNSICIQSDTVAWITGAAGTILKTSDSGTNWLLVKTPITDDLCFVYFSDLNNGIAFSIYGNLLIKTYDGGLSWKKIDVSPTDNGYYKFFIDSLNGYSVGQAGRVFRTNNGGLNWEKQWSGVQNNLNSSFFLDTATGWIAGEDGIILKTTNGGYDWIQQISRTMRSLYSIQFIDSLQGWAVGELGTIVTTTDGGTRWVEISSSIDNYLQSVNFIDSKNGIAVGNNGEIIVTDDGGLNWIQKISGTNEILKSVKFINNSTAIITGTKGTLLISKDKGNSWLNINSGSDFKNNLRSVFFINKSVGFVAGEGIVAKTTNGGNYWNLLNINIQPSDRMNSISFTNENLGWTAGSPNYIYKTTDGGISWFPKASNTVYAIYSLNFPEPNIGYAAGGYIDVRTNHGVMLKTTDSGESWFTLNYGRDECLFATFFINSQKGFAVGEHGFVFKTTDGGITWNEASIGWANRFYSIYFSDENNGIIVGTGNNYFQTSDGGNTWFAQSFNPQNYYYLYSAFAIVPEKIYCAGAEGTILGMTDTLTSFQRQETLTSYNLNSIFFIDASTGWIVGDNGTILKTTNGGVTFVEEENGITAPKDFLLEQNYPNPFNPTTTINYQIPQAGQVSLKVYDLLGREAITLVNEEKPAGSYEANVDGSCLSSGIYFYQLKVGDFIQTKKFVLMK